MALTLRNRAAHELEYEPPVRSTPRQVCWPTATVWNAKTILPLDDNRVAIGHPLGDAASLLVAAAGLDMPDHQTRPEVLDRFRHPRPPA
jgi:hypothetical protein